MECVLQVDAFGFMECMDSMAISNDCYNDGVEKIVNESERYPQCRDAIAARPQGGEKRETTEADCLDRVLAEKPHKLAKLDYCFTPQKTCFENLIRESHIVCSDREQDEMFMRGSTP